MGDTISDWKLGNSTGWVEKWTAKNWDATEQCMKETKLCDSKMMKFLDNNNNTVAGYLFRKTVIYHQLSPVQVFLFLILITTDFFF